VKRVVIKVGQILKLVISKAQILCTAPTGVQGAPPCMHSASTHGTPKHHLHSVEMLGSRYTHKAKINRILLLLPTLHASYGKEKLAQMIQKQLIRLLQSGRAYLLDVMT